MPRNIFDEVYKKFSRLIKQQKTQLDELYELEEKTNRLLIQNKKNQEKQAKEIAKTVSGTSIASRTLENAWKTITTGIDNTE
ncbi:MAG: toxic anion resistance protein [Oscillospiraceae bacterium]|nr:toxic anion resistance protein [Oscillospiraceae bacterium]